MKLKASEKMILIIMIVFLGVIMLLFVFNEEKREYVNVSCPKCGAEEMVRTYVDRFDVEHLLCLGCEAKFTMQEIEDMEDLVDESEHSPAPDNPDEPADSLYDPEMECPD